MLIKAEDSETVGPWPLPVDYLAGWQKLSGTGYWTAFWAHWWGNPDPLDDLDGFTFNVSRVLFPPSLRMPQLSPSGGRMFVTEDFARLRLRILKMWTAINMTSLGGEGKNRWVRSPMGGVLLPGQPGVGKSVFLWYLMTFLLQHKQRIVLSIGQSILEFRYDGVYRSMFPQPFIDMITNPLQFWSLIDMTSNELVPQAVTLENAFPVHAVDCLDCNPSWVRNYNMEVFIWGMPPWSNVQALTAAVKLDRRASSSTDSVIQDLIRKYGPIPRTVIEAADNIRFDEVLIDRWNLTQFQQLDLDLQTDITRLGKITKTWSLPPHVDFPHGFFLIEPIPDAQFAGSDDTWRIRFVSQYVKNLAEQLCA
ncbi:hypothetical protein BDZ89DRAFT_574991 [Hymenopellis radicata]|nr:hypothetical protein BDZ89DRAFT_574991 [Hymenopellis radicata]